MIKKFILLVAILPFFYGCKTQPAKDADGVIVAKGGVRYGGTFRFMSSEKVTSLFPLQTTDIYSNRIVSQIFEGLVKVDPESTELVPSIAASTEVNDNSSVFTFHLRTDVYFQDDPCFKEGKGRKVTAHDFKYSLEFACSGNELNHVSYLLKDKIEGGNAYYKGEADHVSGIVVKDDSTLVITLNRSFSAFKKVMSHAGLGVFPKEAYEKYGEEIGKHPVGTGAFVLDEFTADKISLGRNDNYWRKDEFGNPMPFLNHVVMTYSKDKTDELLSFRAKKIDLVLDIPVEEVQNVLGTLQEAQEGKNVKHRVISKSSLNITYYGFANQSDIFSNKKVRKAFNIAINRKAIIDDWLRGEGLAASHGFVPKMEGYPYTSVKGYTFDIEKAKKLLAEAGYPNGGGFPTVTLYVNAKEGSGGDLLAQAVKKSLKDNINVNVNIELVTFEDREQYIQDGKAIFWRAGWIADYPDPENFLSLFYGGNIGENSSVVNPFKYNNPEYDSLFEKALIEADEEKRMELLAKCDQMIIDDAVVMPLKTDDFIAMVNLKVRRFVTNEVEQLDFSDIYIKEIKE